MDNYRPACCLRIHLTPDVPQVQPSGQLWKKVTYGTLRTISKNRSYGDSLVSF